MRAMVARVALATALVFGAAGTVTVHAKPVPPQDCGLACEPPPECGSLCEPPHGGNGGGGNGGNGNGTNRGISTIIQGILNNGDFRFLNR